MTPPPSGVGTFLNLGLFWNGLTPPLKWIWDFSELGIFLKWVDPPLKWTWDFFELGNFFKMKYPLNKTLEELQIFDNKNFSFLSIKCKPGVNLINVETSERWIQKPFLCNWFRHTWSWKTRFNFLKFWKAKLKIAPTLPLAQAVNSYFISVPLDHPV